MDHIDRLRQEFEATLLRIDGIVGVSRGHDDEGQPYLRVLCSQQADTVEPKLPEAVRAHTVLVYVGEIEAQ